MFIESIEASEHSALLQLAVDTGLFSPEEAQSLLGSVLEGLANSAMPEGHQAACCRAHPGAPPVGWCYFAPDDYASGVWNLWWIGVLPAHHGTGAGKLLLSYVEEVVSANAGRLLIIETSDSVSLARARKFYANQGYAECGRVPHFYAVGESKVIFARSLPSAA